MSIRTAPRLVDSSGRARVFVGTSDLVSSITRRRGIVGVDLMIGVKSAGKPGFEMERDHLMVISVPDPQARSPNVESVGEGGAGDDPDAVLEHQSPRNPRAAGACAFERLRSTPVFDEFLDAVLEHLMIRHTAAIEGVELTAAFAGEDEFGTTFGDALADALSDHIIDNTDAVVHKEIIRIGSLGLVGLGREPHVRTAHGLEQTVGRVFDNSRQLREVRSLVLCEVPITGEDRASRERFVTGLMEGLNLPEVKQVRDGVLQHAATDTRFGSILLVDAAWWPGLDAITVASEVAEIYRDAFSRVPEFESQSGIVRSLETSVAAEESPVASSQAIVSLAEDRSRAGSDDLLSLSLMPPVRHRDGSVVVRLRDERELDLTQVACTSFPPARTLSEIRSGLVLTQAILEKVNGALLERRLQVEHLRHEITHLRRRLAAGFARLTARGLRKLLYALFGPRRTRITRRLAHSIARAREQLARLSKVDEEVRALAEVKNALERWMKTQETRLDRIRKLLGKVEVRGSSHGAPLVSVRTPDEVFEPLLRVSTQPSVSEDDLVSFLVSCVDHLTTEGLAACVGAGAASIPHIARRLNRADHAEAAPPWGGSRPMSLAPGVLLIPPFSPAGNGELRKEIERSSPSDGLRSLVTTTSTSGFDVLTLGFRPCTCEDDVFTAFIRRKLERAREEPPSSPRVHRTPA